MPQLIIRLMIYDSQLFKQDYKDVKYLYNDNLQNISFFNKVNDKYKKKDILIFVR